MRVTHVEDADLGWRRAACPRCGTEYSWNDLTCLIPPACCGERLRPADPTIAPLAAHGETPP